MKHCQDARVIKPGEMGTVEVRLHTKLYPCCAQLQFPQKQEQRSEDGDLYRVFPVMRTLVFGGLYHEGPLFFGNYPTNAGSGLSTHDFAHYMALGCGILLPFRRNRWGAGGGR